jgi:orotate phosphoribosyltransferase
MSSSEIKSLVLEKALVPGLELNPVTLASGTQSTTYYDVKKLLSDPDDLRAVTEGILYAYGIWLGKHGAAKIWPASIGGIESGSIPLATSLSLTLNVPTFYVRKQKKDHGLQDKKRIEGTLISPCFIIEDVTSTGLQLMDAIIQVQSQDVKILAVFAVVDRTHGRLQNVLENASIPYIPLYTHQT